MYRCKINTGPLSHDDRAAMEDCQSQLELEIRFPDLARRIAANSRERDRAFGGRDSRGIQVEFVPEPTAEKKTYYWIAINGASCAASMIPAESVQVSPVPEQMFGFPTREEQLKAQKICLEAPINDVADYLESLIGRIKSGDIVYVRPKNPQPPTHGPTLWMC